MTDNCIPVTSSTTNNVIENGWGGNKPLPVTDMNKMTAIQWVIPRSVIKKMMRSPHALNLLIADDGSMSMAVMPVQKMKGN